MANDDALRVPAVSRLADATELERAQRAPRTPQRREASGELA
jgi:hypothetical protein